MDSWICGGERRDRRRQRSGDGDGCRNSGAPRSGTLRIAGQTVSVSQAGDSRAPASDSPSERVGNAGDERRRRSSRDRRRKLLLWNAVSNAPWIAVTDGSSRAPAPAR